MPMITTAAPTATGTASRLAPTPISRADKLEPEVWGFVSNLLKTPDLLRARLGRLIEEECAETPLERAKCGRRSSPRWIASGPRGNSHHGPQGTGRAQ
jgi:hypothetical protein